MEERMKLKRKMLFSLIVPYMAVSLAALLFIGYKYHETADTARTQFENENKNVLNNVTQEIDYLISDIENLTVEIELDNRLMKLLSIKENRSGSDNYYIAMALTRLRSINRFNHLIEDVILYYRQGDFFLNASGIKDEAGIWGDYLENQTVRIEEWKGSLTIVCPQGSIIRAGDAVYYIVSVPFNETKENCNIIVKINSKRFSELMNDFSFINESQIFLFDSSFRYLAGSKETDRETAASLKDRVFREVSAKEGQKGRICSQGQSFYYVWTHRNRYYCTVLSDWKNLQNQIFYIRIVYLGGGILFSLLLFSGFYGISANYKKILSIIERLGKKYGKETDRNYSEFDYINYALTNMEETIQLHEDAVLDNCIRKAIYGLIDEKDENWKKLQQNNQNLCNCPSMIAIFQDNAHQKKEIKETKLDIFIIGNVLREIFEEKMACWIIPVYHWEIVVLNCKDGMSVNPQFVIAGLKKGRDFLQNYLQIIYTVGLSDPADNINAFSNAYKEAMTALEKSQVLGNGQVIYYGDLKDEDGVFEYTELSEKQLKNNIKLGEYDKAARSIREIFEKAFQKNPVSPEAGKLLILNLIRTLNETAKEMSIPDRMEPLLALKKGYDVYDSLEELLNMTKHLCGCCVQSVSTSENRQYQIRNYIMKHYQDVNLNVAMIADEFHLNSSYLSRFFKEETGENLLSYINRYRIEQVKYLLTATEETITIIAGKTGFINAASLTRTFKKYEGITPGQYKAIHQSGKK